MSKQRIIIAGSIFLVLLILIFSSIYIFQKKLFQNNQEEWTKISAEEDAAAATLRAMDKLKADICQKKDPFSVADINSKIADPALQEAIRNNFHDNDLANIQGYYFCDGFVNDNAEEACANNLRSKKTIDQCKNSFNFFKMIFASLNGEKEKAAEMCKTVIGIDNVCKYINSLQDIKNKNVCSEMPEENKSFCYAFFAGDETYCDGGKDVEFCKLSAPLLEILISKNESSCDKMISFNELDNRNIFCKLKVNKDPKVCIDYKYKKFIQSFCGENN